MAYFKDLTPYSYHVSPYTDGADALNVGWLAKCEEIPLGTVPIGFIERLRALCAKPINLCRGWHTCEFCGKSSGNGEIRVQGDGVLYAAPKMVGHYVSTHGYCPPQAFIDAVMAQVKPE